MSADTIDRLFASFEPSFASATTERARRYVLLNLHRAVARHLAEGRWLAISTDPRFLSEEMSEHEVNDRLEQSVLGLLQIVGKLHEKHGVADAAFNSQAAEDTVKAFYDRLREVAAPAHAGGRA